jgi:hypothetical protein
MIEDLSPEVEAEVLAAIEADDPPRPSRLPAAVMLAWLERDPASYHAAVRLHAARMVDDEVARRLEADPWYRAVRWALLAVLCLLALWAIAFVGWLLWAR